ncbi:MAG: hypothetical protein ABFD82_11460 [Syntrophaceae bacterium]
MKHFKWQIILGISLVALSAIFYFIHFLIFRDAHHIFIYLLGDIAFVFIEVLLVTMIIHEVLAMREKRLLLEKLNIVIGSFFSEVGKDLLKLFSACDPESEKIRQELIVTDKWSDAQFLDMSNRLQQYSHDIDITKSDMEGLKQLLLREREFMLRLLENQNLLEHDTFTGLLMAVFHLTEELESRADIMQLQGADKKHIANDMKRVYSLLISEWLSYMKHLKDNYPYLFSFAMRTNPFDLNATPEIKG